MRKITFLLSALIIAFTSVSAQDPVAKIGDVEYGTLQEAVDAVTADQEIVLLADLELANAVNLNKEVAYTLNLGGKTLEFKNALSGTYLLELSVGDVAVKNGIIRSDKKAIHVTGGKLTLKSDVAIEAAERVLGIYNAGHVVVENGCELETTADEEWGIVIIGSTSAVTGNPQLDFAGKLTASGSESMGISGNGLDKNQPVINILDGAQIIANHVAIYQPGNATMTISGGTITGATAVYVKSGNVSITGGKLVGNGAAADYSFNNNGANPTGEALVIDNCNYPSGAIPAVTITGGKFESANAAAVASYVGNNVPETEKVVDFIKGGTFNGKEALSAALVKADADIIIEDAVINVDPTAWKTELNLIDGKADADKLFEISGEHLIASISGEVIGENKDNFTWNKTREVLKFHAEASGTYKAQLVLSSKGAENKVINLEIVVKAPAPDPEITVKPAEWNLNLTLEIGKAVQAEQAVVIIAKNLVADLFVEIQGGAGSKFAWDAENQRVIFSSKAAGVFEDTLVVSSDGAETKKVALRAVVTTPGPTLIVKPAEWKTSIELVNGEAKAERSISIKGLYLISDTEVAIKEADSKFAWNDDESKVVFAANEVGTYKATLVVSAEGAESVEVALEVEVTAPVAPVAVTGVTLDKEAAELKIGETLPLVATVVPADADNKAVTWASDKPEIASVANGVVTAVAEGSAVITVKTEDGNFTATCAVTVTKAAPVAVIGVTLDKATAEVKVGKTITLVATVAPANVTNKNVSWSSDKPEIATVANGVVTGVAEGSAVITVKTDDGGFTASCTVTVKNSETPPGPQPGGCDAYSYTFTAAMSESAALGEYDWTLVLTGTDVYTGFDTQNGKGAQFGSEKKPAEAVSLTTANVADCLVQDVTINASTASQGNAVLAVFIGGTQIGEDVTLVKNSTDYTFQNTSSLQGELEIRITNSAEKAVYIKSISITFSGGEPVDPVAVTGVTLNQTTGEVEVGQTLTLIATIAPANATNKKVTWSSDNEAIATVANGVVTGVAEGSAVITVKTEDGNFTATCAVTVTKAAPVAVIGVTLDKATAEVKVGKTMTLVASIAPANASNKAVTWSSDKPEIATVANGVVTGVAEGSAVITVKTDDGGFTASCTVTVKKSETPPGPQPGGCDAYSYTFTAAMSESAALGEYDWTLVLTGTDVYTGFDTQNGKGAQFGSGKKPAEAVSLTTANVADCLVQDVTINASTASQGKAVLAVFIGGTQIGEDVTLVMNSTDYTFQNTSSLQGELEIRITNSAEKAVYIKSISITFSGGEPVDPVAVTGVSLDKATAEVEVGKTIKLTATIAPANATNKKVTWSSDNETIATVANGVVTGVAEGAAVITVKTEDGDFTATCAVTVKKSETPPGPQPGELTFTKVTEAPADWSGQYLIVCDDKSVVFNGLDAVKNGVAATIADNKVTVDNYAKYVVTIAQMEGGYSVQIGGQYIGGKLASGAAANGIEFSATPILNTITLANGVTNVESNGSTIRFNGKDDQLRFRYFKNSSLKTNTDLVQVSLYKASGSVGPTPVWVPDTISVVEAIEACKDSKTHYVDGIIKSISTTPEDIEKYGNLNFMLGDIDNPDVEISCFRLYWKTADGKFVGGEVAVGDTVRVFGTTNIYTKGEQSTNQISNGYIVEKLSGGEPVPPTPVFEINFVEAGYIEYEGEQYWQIFAGKLPENDDAEDYDYPHLVLFVDNTNATHIAGTFELYEGSFIVLAEGDTTFFVSGEIAVKCLQAATVKEDAYYSFIVTAIDEAGEEHVYEFKADVIAYDIMKSTEEETAWIDLEDQAGDEAIENINADAVSAKKVIKNGTIYIIRDGKMYNITGAVVE